MDGQERRGLRGRFLVLTLAMAGIYLATANYGVAQSTDSGMVAVSAWTLAEHGTLDLSRIDDELFSDEVARSETVAVDGRLYTDRFPGAIFMAAPFYLVFPGPTFGAGVAAAVIAALAIGSLYLALARLVQEREAVVAAAVFGLATATWSVSADAMWTHGPAQLGLALAMLAMARGAWGASGLGFGLALFVRPHLGITAVVAGLWTAWQSRSWAPAAKLAVTTALGLAAYLVYGYVLFGTWSPFGGRGAYMGEALAQRGPVEFVLNAFWTLVHPLRGVLVYLPALLWLMPKIREAWRGAPPWVRSSTLAGLGYFVVQAWINRWSGGDAYWTYRYPLESLTLVAPLCVLAFLRLERGRQRIVWILLGLSVAVQGAGAIFDLRT